MNTEGARRNSWSKALLTYGIYAIVVILALHCLTGLGFWDSSKSSSALLGEMFSGTKREQPPPPDLYMRPTTMKFKTSTDTKVSIWYEGAAKGWGEIKAVQDLQPGQIAGIEIDSWYAKNAETIEIHKNTGYHAGEPETVDMFGDRKGWADNKSFRGKILKVEPGQVTIGI